MEFEKNILCIGAGYVGGPTMSVKTRQTGKQLQAGSNSK